MTTKYSCIVTTTIVMVVGCIMMGVVVNGEVVAQGSQFSLKDVEVVVAQVDLDAVCYDFHSFIMCMFFGYSESILC